ncbi:DUF1707 domain-containing protein [Nonomuraea sp. AD125B]|uniref:DUF1707 SHOCT-like domain-containing protein n=1 Tax=Nonomuraea sp. AD125B TaxID=3242897 RepID=UPI003527428F
MSDLHMRVSDEDRERTAGRLQHAFVEGRLTRAAAAAGRRGRATLPEGGTANVDGFRSDWGHVSTADVPGRPRLGVPHVVVTGVTNYGGLTVRYPRKRWFTH